jgi:hypothetical protein
LTLLLFASEEDSSSSSSRAVLNEILAMERTKEDDMVFKRSQLFDSLVRYFPQTMTQPKINLVDLLPL